MILEVTNTTKEIGIYENSSIFEKNDGFEGQVNHKVCLFLNMVDTSKRKDGKEKREAPIPIGSQ